MRDIVQLSLDQNNHFLILYEGLHALKSGGSLRQKPHLQSRNVPKFNQYCAT